MKTFELKLLKWPQFYKQSSLILVEERMLRSPLLLLFFSGFVLSTDEDSDPQVEMHRKNKKLVRNVTILLERQSEDHFLLILWHSKKFCSEWMMIKTWDKLEATDIIIHQVDYISQFLNFWTWFHRRTSLQRTFHESFVKEV